MIEEGGQQGRQYSESGSEQFHRVQPTTLMKNKVFWSPNLSQLILDFCFEKASSTPCKKVQ
ncbi:hypothetical protein F2Q70_00034543 [Brassica cretica]|uniref:Uncharacterized protein n=1 Tax=Brassica cretica TaxID=69181 RepID=A0A8S9JZB7_BRACR|nr:hypothetical protein F2Q70_00034543 [Brassica cretica]